MKGSENPNVFFSGAVMENLGHEKCNGEYTQTSRDLVLRVVFVESSLYLRDSYITMFFFGLIHSLLFKHKYMLKQVYFHLLCSLCSLSCDYIKFCIKSRLYSQFSSNKKCSGTNSPFSSNNLITTVIRHTWLHLCNWTEPLKIQNKKTHNVHFQTSLCQGRGERRWQDWPSL